MRLESVAQHSQNEQQDQARAEMGRQLQALQGEVQQLRRDKNEAFTKYGDKLKSAAQMNKNLRDEIDSLKDQNRQMRVARGSQMYEKERPRRKSSKKKSDCTLM